MSNLPQQLDKDETDVLLRFLLRLGESESETVRRLAKSLFNVLSRERLTVHDTRKQL